MISSGVICVSMQSFYFDDKPAMSNEEFDNLKEELLWEGSKVAVLRYAADIAQRQQGFIAPISGSKCNVCNMQCNRSACSK